MHEHWSLMTGNKDEMRLHWQGIKVADSWTCFLACADVLYAVSPDFLPGSLRTRIPEN